MRENLIAPLLADFLIQQRLPATFQSMAMNWYLPLAQLLARRVVAGETQCLGISGCQGSGKSTLAALLARLLEDVYGLRVAVLSLDDFYLTLAQRRTLADSVHPLFITRGVPGTHDSNLATESIRALLNPTGGTALIPRFDKARDDRAQWWQPIEAPRDLVILEGWCLGLSPQSVGALQRPVNELERGEDPLAIWRSYVNQQLAGPYQQLFSLMDFGVFLQAPSFDAVARWRGLQEAKLAARQQRGSAIMDEVKLARFIQHYERLTRHGLATLPQWADCVFQLDDNQTIVRRIDKHNK